MGELMAIQNLIDQTVVFISANRSYDENKIFNNNLIQTLAQNSIGSDLLVAYQNFKNFDSINGWTDSSAFTIRCFILPAFQATVQSSIPSLQSAFPEYTIVTWGHSVSFGN